MTDWKGVIRDIVIILVLMFLGTFIAASIIKTTNNQKSLITAIAALNILLGSIGFTISGVTIKVNRFKHILKVALGVWLVGSANVIFLQTTIVQWLSSIFFILIMMVIGGSISYLLAKPVKTG